MITAPVDSPAAGTVSTRARPWRAAPVALVALVSVVVLVWPRPALWLDEAQSVAIARRSLPGIVDALRADGAPPIYYVVLHLWMSAFGTSDAAVRSLSIVCALLAVATLTIVARRAIDGHAAAVALLLTISNPFFVRYATETRMYALVMLEVSVGALALQRWCDTSRRRWLVLFGVACWTVALTHYWGISIVVATGACLAAAGLQRRREGNGLRWAAAAAAAGLVCAAFWFPVMHFQSRHTGTPWTQPSGIRRAVVVTMHRSTGPSLLAAFVSVTLGLLFGAALVAGSGRLRTDRRLRETSRLLALVFVATFVLSYAVTRATHSAFVARYTMTMFPLHILLATCGACWLLSRRLGLALATVIWAAGLTVAITQIDAPRTRAPVFADALAAEAKPGDVVLYCPDQLGPPLVRLLDQRGVHIPQQWTYPEFGSPDRVDWIDYGDRHREASPTAFATEAVRRAGAGDVWLVLSVTHPPTEEACAGVRNALRALRPDVEVRVPDRGDWHEHDSLLRFPSAAAPGQG